MTKPDPLMSTDEVAEYLRLSQGTVTVYARSGELPAMKVGGRWRFKRRDVERWLKRLQHEEASRLRGEAKARKRQQKLFD
jgi:excisionase family DNA binding protein